MACVSKPYNKMLAHVMLTSIDHLHKDAIVHSLILVELNCSMYLRHPSPLLHLFVRVNFFHQPKNKIAMVCMSLLILACADA